MNNDYNNNNNYQQPYQQPYDPAYQGGIDPALESKATQALVFGILGLFFAGIIFGILAIVNSNTCKKAGYNNGKVTAGFVLGIIDLAAMILYVIAFAVWIPAAIALL